MQFNKKIMVLFGQLNRPLSGCVPVEVCYFEGRNIVKKLTLINLIVFGLFVFNITQASAGCNIVWTGNSIDYYGASLRPVNGSIPTNETAKTQQAAQELYNELHFKSCLTSEPMGYVNNACYGDDGYGYRSFFYKWVCIDGTWESGFEFGSTYCDGSCSCGAHGTWDVICDGSITTTTVQQVTTTTTLQSTTTTTALATLIDLSSITATPEFNKVIIQWSTESEINNVGFNLYRAESENGEYIQINDSLIPSKGSSTQGASYEFVDNDVKNRKTYYYKLEDIDLNGISTLHGPITATPRLIFGMGK
jgi:hypothetical protein